MFASPTLIRPLINNASKALSRYTLVKHLPVLAVHWFQNIERISGGVVRLKFDPVQAVFDIRSRNPWGSVLAKDIIIANSRWNIIWGQYCIELLQEIKGYPWLEKNFRDMIRRNTLFLATVNEKPVPKPEFKGELIKSSGEVGFDLVIADLVGNSYTDSVWGNLIEGLEAFSLFRTRYVDLINGETSIEMGVITANMAKSIALAEISWSKELVPWEDLSMVGFESAWRIYFRTGMLDNFLIAANRAGAGLPVLSSKDIIRRIAANPGVPIEEVLA